MGVLRIMHISILCWVFLLLLNSTAKCSSTTSELSVKFLRAPHAFSHLNSATFAFQALNSSASRSSCTNCSFTCKLDDGITSVCKARRVIYSRLRDGNHSFEVCAKGLQGLSCAKYNWTVDTVPPTALVTTSTSFTSALNVSVDITFSEPCIGEGLGCISVNSCNLLVYGAGQAIPSSFTVLQPNLKYSLLISLSSKVQYGRVILVMDKNFCTDMAGNSFTRTPNSSVYVRFDRRWDSVNLRTRVPERLLQLNSETRTVLATNDYNKLKVFVYFSEPVLNSSTDIVKHLSINRGSLLPTGGKTRRNRRFGFLIANISSNTIISVSFNSTSIISRQGIPVAPVAPVAFLYDSLRPSVNLSTYSKWTQEHNIQILVKFVKPVFGFNSSCISLTGGNLRSFHEISRSIYIIELQADDKVISIIVPENVTSDVAGNKNLASNVLEVRHCSRPLISIVISTFATASFVLTSLAAGLLTICTASLQYFGAFSRQSSFLTVDPARSLFRIICYIQIFALSNWLSVNLPIEFYEFTKNLQWTIPYLLVPWETRNMHLLLAGSSPFGSSNLFVSKVPTKIPIMNLIDNPSNSASVYGLPLTSSEYQLYFENSNVQPKAEFISDSQHSSGWTEFSRSMFWLAVIFGALMILHAFLLYILKFRKRNSEKPKKYGALTFPRFEIFLLFLALPGICKASTALVRGSLSGMVVGILLLVFVSLVLIALFLFLSIGITFGKLLQYKEVHQEGQRFHWYQELVRVTLGPGKRGQWTWKELPNSVRLIILGPLFEDLRGPPKYMLSQIAGGHPHNSQGDRIIASEDETEDAEAPFIQKLFGILRIYYVLVESIRRVSFGTLAGVYNKTEPSKTPTTIILSISAFQLFFVVLKKPFIKKRVQLVEIISLSCEVALFATCLALSNKDFSAGTDTKFGIFMLILFLVGFLAHILNEWYALYRQTRLLDPEEKSFLRGLKIASIGFLLYFTPQRFIKSLESRFPKNHVGVNEETTRDDTFSDERFKNFGGRSCSVSTDKPWLKQLRELAKDSFVKEGSANDPSTSTTGWSGIWGSNNKRSGSSSMNSSSDFKSKPSGLSKDLEAIFGSK
ncbi:hypothetical protein QN277_010324 [Acacia crassicarpa]|uniref:Bacterial Ig-like domain-containing protein n=1 Tax=Acacia crassicarpa TaxID=499986 RepID=A0AAE1IPI6_9FABA|nr:hypothetical protein QN277_010324 [Acacia crassicarpa]